MTDDAKILETVIAEFEALTHIPRPSGHERAVSDYLKKRFTEIGCTVTQDEALNRCPRQRSVSLHRARSCRGIWTWSALQSRA